MAASQDSPVVPIDLTHFGLREMLRCGNAVRSAARGASCLEAAAQAIVSCLCQSLHHAAEARSACVLVRAFVTRPLSTLDAEMQAAARSAAGDLPLPPDVNCLVLVATIGDEPAWCDRRLSAGHRVIPLLSAETVRGAPMLARLFEAFGIPIAALVGSADPERLLHVTSGKTYGVFHVPEARGSPYVPAQRDFVERYGVRSVLGFGASLVTGDLGAVIMFTRADISEEVADRFRAIALELKGVLHRFGPGSIFAPPREGTAC